MEPSLQQRFIQQVKDKLPLSTLVWLCEADEDWQGIVYPTGNNQELGDCRVSSSVRRAYSHARV